MIHLATLERELKRDEGFRASPYMDTMGVATIGHGRTSYASGEKVSLSDPAVTIEQAGEWLRSDMVEAIKLVQSMYTDFEDLPSLIQMVLANMAFNLGFKLQQFKRMNAAIDMRDWRDMADEMKNSRWYGQVGQRAERLLQKVLQCV